MAASRLPLIVGLAGTALDRDEAAFLRETRPVGLILFARNVDTPDQVRKLVDAARAALDDPDPLVLVDQEGGRVARLKPPHWPSYPPMARFGGLYGRDPAAAREAVWLALRLIAHDLASLGITVDCAPVLDVPTLEADPVISDRAFAERADVVADLGGAAVDGLLAGGVLPVIKHIPGHGRAGVDSHKALPRVTADLDTLARMDFAPFAALARAPMAMTAHIVYTALDPARPATCSPRVIAEVVRGQIGFDNLLLSDDLEMAALDGTMAERAAAALTAGCDLALHCSGDLGGVADAANGCPPLAEVSARRLADAKAARRPADTVDIAHARRRLSVLLGDV
ncbi:beta-N-acetylhexosaminidase [Rhodothalassium salexigens DSM 2132]|uniref:beta-N-acetylhexosaminidase n=1 Tax=Rhodothalassium salexigens DSM 2132 TaxID=1188247 RepID=A0A4R2PRP1_RHOSA|nr:beta-N-acetylhexosaminidase [Rhodothalassium salexigens]MBB4210345.1 beta-N-acetylhexosaminidase [Rhodothalassium salexigens DSM 2132]MBK1638886.1 beta-N-acetylhexosaminidase [Rhodothalassium salexigens DSM 2132]TCP38509.1 beta-N-acetylhexosaminidase [Rhodothalassium salexigens DSM 2132]